MPAFWDTSALIPLCVPGQANRAMRRVFDAHAPVVWWAAAVEARSALERIRFERTITEAAYWNSRQRLNQLIGSCREVQPTDAVRDLACAELERSRLRASDALQLAAALIWCKQSPRGRLFVSMDNRLSFAARRVGFQVPEF